MLAKVAQAEPKGRPPIRPCPEDFDVIFVEKGRDGCESWYRARKTTVTRWLEERGKEKLISRRAAYVASMRKAGKWMTRSTRLVETRAPAKVVSIRAAIVDRRRVSLTLARHAAQFLRINRNGGWIVSQASNGDWRVGTKQMSAAQLVDVAVGRGFDATAANLQADDERGVG